MRILCLHARTVYYAAKIMSLPPLCNNDVMARTVNDIHYNKYNHRQLIIKLMLIQLHWVNDRGIYKIGGTVLALHTYLYSTE